MWGSSGLAIGIHGKKTEAEGQKPTGHHVTEEDEGNREKQREIFGKYQMKQPICPLSGKEDLRGEGPVKIFC